MYRFIYILIAFTLYSCSSGSNNDNLNINNTDLLAKVDNKKLYIENIPKHVFKNLEEKDSLDVLNNYVTNWIKDEVFALKAKEIIKDLNKIKTEAENYKKKLIINSYDQLLLQNIEIDLTDEDLNEYYEKHKNYFVLDENYFEIKYIILPKTISSLAKIKKDISKGQKSNWITNYCQKYISKCHLEKGDIRSANFLTEEFKFTLAKLKPNSAYKFKYIDKDNVIIYRIVKVYKKGNFAPLEIVKNEVSRLALHSKKQEYLESIKEKIYQKAKDDQIFEKYIN